MNDTPQTDALEKTTMFATRPKDPICGEALLHARKMERERNEAIEIARKAMETVMQIYGHAQFCDECQSFEIADSCRIQMHGMDRINSLENSKAQEREASL